MFSRVQYSPGLLSDSFLFDLLRLPPETMMDNGIYTPKSDVWAFGLVLWEILTRKIPYEGKTSIQVIRSIDGTPCSFSAGSFTTHVLTFSP
jgi:serine/threonine protein kinase